MCESARNGHNSTIPFVKHFDIRKNFTSLETRGIVLPDAENRMIVSSFLWTQYRNATDIRTDGQRDRRNPSGCSALHCEQCGHGVIK